MKNKSRSEKFTILFTIVSAFLLVMYTVWIKDYAEAWLSPAASHAIQIFFVTLTVIGAILAVVNAIKSIAKKREEKKKKFQ